MDQQTATGLALKIFDSSTGAISTIAEGLNFTNLVNKGSIGSPLAFHVSQSQNIPIVAGWNWISFTVFSSDGTPRDQLKGYPAHDNDVIKGDNGFATFSQGSWYASSPNFHIQPGKMYMLKSAVKTTMTVSGLPPSSPVSIQLVSGYNWIGYPKMTPSAASSVLTGLNTKDDDFIYGKDWSDTYYQSKWYPSTPENPQMEPGKGYFLYVSAAQTLNF